MLFLEVVNSDGKNDKHSCGSANDATAFSIAKFHIQNESNKQLTVTEAATADTKDLNHKSDNDSGSTSSRDLPDHGRQKTQQQNAPSHSATSRRMTLSDPRIASNLVARKLVNVKTIPSGKSKSASKLDL